MRHSRPTLRELRGLWRLGRLARTTFALTRAGRRLGSFDIVHANDLDTLPSGFLLTRDGARLVYDAHEIYTDQEPDPPRAHRAIASIVEGTLARKADAVVTVSEPIARELRKRLRLETTPIAVLNCPERYEGELHLGPQSGPLRAVYQGAMGPGRPLSDLLVAARHADDVSLTLRVVGAPLAELRAAVTKRGLEGQVEIAEPVPPRRLVEALRKFEVGLVINRPLTKNDELAFPNKLFEYLMAGLAVAVPRLPGIAPLVESEEIGVVYEPGRPEALGAALTALARDRPRLAEMRRRARRLALERYNAETQARALVKVWT